MFELNLSVTDALDAAEIPSREMIHRWVENALQGRRDEGIVDVRVVDEAEMRELNRTYRHKDRPTNVLSFPAELPPGTQFPLLGDLAICAPVVEREAAEQGKAQEHHWAHLVTHGILHLLGYDHLEEADAETMEAAEREILARLGIPDPYGG